MISQMAVFCYTEVQSVYTLTTQTPFRDGKLRQLRNISCQMSFMLNTNIYVSCVIVLCMFSLNFRHIESVVIVFHIQTIFCCCHTQDGVSPVYVASKNGHTEIVDLLVQAGADIHLASTDKVHVS